MASGLWQVLTGLLVVAVVVEGLLLVGVIRQVGTILLQIAPPRPGVLDGGPDLESQVDLGLEDRAAVVMFLAPDCQPCEQLVPSLPVFVRNYPEFELIPIVVAKSTTTGRRFADELDPSGRLDMVHLFSEWNVPGTPFAVGVDRDGRVRSKGVVNNLDQLESLAETVRFAAQRAVVDADEAIIAEVATR